MGELQNWINDIGNVIKSGGTSTNDRSQSRDKSNDRDRRSSKKDDDDDYPLWDQNND